jgi:hypothetical protein
LIKEIEIACSKVEQCNEDSNFHNHGIYGWSRSWYGGVEDGLAEWMHSLVNNPRLPPSANLIAATTTDDDCDYYRQCNKHRHDGHLRLAGGVKICDQLLPGPYRILGWT